MRRSLIIVLAVVFASAITHSSIAQAVRGPKPVQSALQDKTPSSSEFVGSETCATCHAAEAGSFGSNAHARLALMHNGHGATCESCHGPGKAHVESGGDATKIFQFSKATPKQIDARCLSCHVGDHPNAERTAHGEAGVSCTSCHSVHAAKSEAHMLTAPQPKLCYGCHTDVRASFAQPFHHKVNEGLVGCTDCHNPHGTFQEKMLRTSAEQSAVCVKCHAENAGPFVYEHPPVKTEGCTSCHTPHGSPNPRLLTRSTVNSLCMQCHTASFNFTAPGAPSFHNQANQYQACTNCHVQIHGSNTSTVFFK